MLLHSRKRHVVTRGEFADGRVGRQYPRQNVAPRGIGERSEQLVQYVRRGLSIYNHLVAYSSTLCSLWLGYGYRLSSEATVQGNRASLLGAFALGTADEIEHQ